MLWNWPLPLTFTEKNQTLEGVLVAENVNVKGLKCDDQSRKQQSFLSVTFLAVRLLMTVAVDPDCHANLWLW